MGAKYGARTAHESAMKGLSAIAETVGVEGVPVRAKTVRLEAFYKHLCTRISADSVEGLGAAIDKFTAKGIVKRPAEHLRGTLQNRIAWQSGSHMTLQEAFHENIGFDFGSRRIPFGPRC